MELKKKGEMDNRGKRESPLRSAGFPVTAGRLHFLFFSSSSPRSLEASALALAAIPVDAV